MRRYEPKKGTEYPSGYVSPRRTRKDRPEWASTDWDDMDKEIRGVMESIIYRKTDNIPMDTVNHVVQMAMYAFDGGRLGSEFGYQDTNGRFHGHFRAFLIDTIGFIAKGHRSMSIRTWTRLFATQMEEYIEELRGVIKEPSIKQALKDCELELKDSPTPNPIVAWISHEGGFEDMLYTMYILFANVRHYPAPSWQPQVIV